MNTTTRSSSSSSISSSVVAYKNKYGRRRRCYAVASGDKPGIYFSWDEAKEQVIGVSNSRFKGFQLIADAKLFLVAHDLEPIETGDWIPTDGSPILYRPIIQNDSTIPNEQVLDDDGDDAAQKDDGHDHDEEGDDYCEVLFVVDRGHTSAQPEGKTKIKLEHTQDHLHGSTSPLKRPRTECITPDYKNDDSGDDDDNEESDYLELPEIEKPSIAFDKFQQEAIDAAMNGKNIFLTGVAGTGKSLVTQKIVQNAKNRNQQVVVAAPTGVAAVNLNLGAQTLHSLAGVKVPQRVRDFDTMYKPENTKKWRHIEVLVIDEIGMLTADFLDWLDFHVRDIRHRPLEPFGGIQLIFVGDFAQLGPVPGATSLQAKAYDPHEEGAGCFLGIRECTAYAFQSVMWREANFNHIHLQNVYRQSDKEFIQALMDLRESRANSELVDRLVQTCRTPLEIRQNLEIPDGITPTVLYCTNAKVDKENYDNLRALTTDSKCFKAEDTAHVDECIPLGLRDYYKKLLFNNKFFEQSQAPKELELKVGAQVMLLQNLDLALVNGSRGVITTFKLVPVARNVLDNREVLIAPDDVEKYRHLKFEELKYGMHLYFEGSHWRIFKFVKYPLVLFMNGRSKIIVPAPFERYLYRQGFCRRLQVPLRLAWAITIHKSQGSTLDLVVCDLKGCFTTGQAYVALSRAKTMKGLQIRNFDPDRVVTDPLVEEFYRALDKNDMPEFLETKAGIWWYPILEAPSWFNMFQNAKGRESRKASERFRHWVADYKPHEGYSGWKGFSDFRIGTPRISSF